MAISNLSTGLRPGVCTSTTRPSTPFEGQMIYETDTNRVLVYEGAAWVMIADTDTPPGMVLIKTQTVGTAVSSVEVTGVFSSDFDAYRITWLNGTMSNGTDVKLKIGTATANYYQWMTYGAYSAGAATPAGASVNNGSEFLWFGGGDSNAGIVDIDVYGPNLSKYTYARSLGFYAAAANAGFTSGVLRDTTQHTAFTLTPASGTLTGGTIRVYGYRNTI